MPAKAGRHLGTQAVLDYLEGRLDARKRAAAEAHLGFPCPGCRERVRALATLIDRMRSDALEEVPAALRARAIAAFPAATSTPPARSTASRWLALVFDSMIQPMPAATRRAIGAAHRLRFSASGWKLEVECEPEGADRVSVRGRLSCEDPGLHRLEVVAGKELFSCWPDAEGRFALEGLPRRSIALAVHGPAGRWRTRAFEP